MSKEVLIKSKIIACGAYLPSKILTNDDLSKMVDTNDQWIIERTGIKKRHIAADGEKTSDLGYEAAKEAITKSDIKPEDIDIIILATTTADNSFPAAATRIQQKLKANNAAAFDVQAVCSGFVYAVNLADNFIKTGQAQNVLVIGAETLSNLVDWKDRGTCVLFGDGAGAIILQANTDIKDKSDIIYNKLYSDGNFYDILKTTGGISDIDANNKITMEGTEVFKHAVSKMSDAVLSALKELDLEKEDIDFLIPHQANQRILIAIEKKLKLARGQVISSVAEHANTSAASIPLALNNYLVNKIIARGSLVVFVSIGGGLSWGINILRW
jgi:3-oxoacyl-[acyl-carrier-protein] synthase III